MLPLLYTFGTGCADKICREYLDHAASRQAGYVCRIDEPQGERRQHGTERVIPPGHTEPRHMHAQAEPEERCNHKSGDADTRHGQQHEE